MNCSAPAAAAIHGKVVAFFSATAAKFLSTVASEDSVVAALWNVRNGASWVRFVPLVKLSFMLVETECVVWYVAWFFFAASGGGS